MEETPDFRVASTALRERSYMPHVYYTLGSRLTSEDDGNKLSLLWKYGICLYYDWRYWEVEALFERVMETSKIKLGADCLNQLVDGPSAVTTTQQRKYENKPIGYNTGSGCLEWRSLELTTWKEAGMSWLWFTCARKAFILLLFLALVSAGFLQLEVSQTIQDIFGGF